MSKKHYFIEKLYIPFTKCYESTISSITLNFPFYKMPQRHSFIDRTKFSLLQRLLFTVFYKTINFINSTESFLPQNVGYTKFSLLQISTKTLLHRLHYISSFTNFHESTISSTPLNFHLPQIAKKALYFIDSTDLFLPLRTS